jgi:mRNA interferase RelE/StbE
LSYAVSLVPSAARALRKLDPGTRERILRAILALETDPHHVPGTKKLTGREGYRLRVDDYGVLYEVRDEVLRVLVVKVGHRREVYRK